MKLPKLAWWHWLLALYVGAGVALKLKWWEPRDGAGLFWGPVFAPVLLLLRVFASPKSPGADLPIRQSLGDLPSGTDLLVGSVTGGFDPGFNVR